MNIVFGIIIDTFAELRDKRNQEAVMIESSCFMCGIQKEIFEKQQKGDGWNAHIYRDHYVYNYLGFILYI